MTGDRSRGFSLIELVVVLVIISLLTALATPTLTRTIRRQEIRGVSKRISAILRYCRSESVNKSRIYLASIDPSANTLTVQSAEEGEEKLTLQKAYSLPEEVKFGKIEVGKTLFDMPQPTFEFYPNGGSNGGTALIRRGETGGYSIEVDFLTGAVKLEETK